ncbi:N-glycosyltransferase [Botrimarina colliarenosi]|uniref:N-glycosyltransferase n=1 Tax=Botrimarina colliarenosi TaxID=2528001 RepID=A0A5C6AC48_9BACT|nr:glycosyltransferase family 2 protein [Botrimarina colliarenosi]TWT97612.1 N-glycosyltransferase [Botrimarina colliarenosi]
MTPIDAILTGSAALVATPAYVLGAECLLAALYRSVKSGGPSGDRPCVAVVVPAHNEAPQIPQTLASIRPQLGEGDRVIVVADNCSDATAEVAQSHGAEVLVRNSTNERGKGYALRHAFERLRSSPPDVVVCIDADCVATPGAIGVIARLAKAKQRPVQAAYLMESPSEADRPAAGRVSEFAVLVKNFVRPRGLGMLGLPCLLTGSGMAFPWDVLQSVPHPEGHIVEDMRFAVDLTIAGRPPLPQMDAQVVSRLPAREAAVTTQRTRWEHGHLAVILSEAPRLASAFLRSGRPSVLALLLELSVPPLSLLVGVMALALMASSALVALGGTVVPLAILASAVLFATVGLGASWLRYGRQVLPGKTLLAVPGYALRKAPLYASFAKKREQAWVRTARDSGATAPAPHYATERVNAKEGAPSRKTSG